MSQIFAGASIIIHVVLPLVAFRLFVHRMQSIRSHKRNIRSNDIENRTSVNSETNMYHHMFHPATKNMLSHIPSRMRVFGQSFLRLLAMSSDGHNVMRIQYEGCERFPEDQRRGGCRLVRIRGASTNRTHPVVRFDIMTVLISTTFMRYSNFCNPILLGRRHRPLPLSLRRRRRTYVHIRPQNTTLLSYRGQKSARPLHGGRSSSSSGMCVCVNVCVCVWICVMCECALCDGIRFRLFGRTSVPIKLRCANPYPHV